VCFGNEKLNDSLVSGKEDKRNFHGRKETAAMFKDSAAGLPAMTAMILSESMEHI